MRIFVSYRREDSRAHAGRLHDALAAEFGESHIFQDVAAIDPGVDFVAAIDAALDDADAVLVVIGPSWLAPGPDGVSRLNDPEDYVRMETARALRREIKVVPLLVGGASLPHPDDLPEDLLPLTHRQAVELRDEAWQTDVRGLMGSLRGEKVSSRRISWWIALVLLVGVVAVTGTLLLVPDENSLVGCETPREPNWTRFLGPDADTAGSIEGSGGPVEVVVTDGFYQQLEDTERWNVIVEAVVNNEGTDGVYNEDWTYIQLDVNRFPFEEKSCFSTTRSYVEQGESSRAMVGFEVDEAPSGPMRLVVENSVGGVSIDFDP